MYARCLVFGTCAILSVTRSASGYIRSNGCEKIDGGGWELVRHLSPSDDAWHPSTDNLVGTADYGIEDNDAQSINTWSKPFIDSEHNQFLFAFGDCSEYLITTVESAIGELYENQDRCILTSSRSSSPYVAKWYFRSLDFPADPWISSEDHWQCRDDGGYGDHPCMLYGENYPASLSESHIYGIQHHGGGNVWIRQKKNEKRSCCTEKYTCSTWGDPHITTWNGVTYHFQGEGYFDYVKSYSCCSNDGTQGIPFTISAKHEHCIGSGEYTCISEVVVTIEDDVKISYPSSGIPTWKSGSNDVSAIGTYILEGNFIGWYKVSINKFEISFIADEDNVAQLSFEYSGWTLKIEGTDCLDGRIYGLCGYLNKDNSDRNDFTRCDNKEIIDHSGVNFVKPYDMSSLAWSNTHRFGESCCNSELDKSYLGDYVCYWRNNNRRRIMDTFDYWPAVPPRPNATCMNEAEDICKNGWINYCGSCRNDSDSINISISINASDEWISDCVMDFCGQSLCSTNVATLNAITASNLGCLNTSIDYCYHECKEVTSEPTQAPIGMIFDINVTGATAIPTRYPSVSVEPSMNNKNCIFKDGIGYVICITDENDEFAFDEANDMCDSMAETNLAIVNTGTIYDSIIELYNSSNMWYSNDIDNYECVVSRQSSESEANCKYIEIDRRNNTFEVIDAEDECSVKLTRCCICNAPTSAPSAVPTTVPTSPPTNNVTNLPSHSPSDGYEYESNTLISQNNSNNTKYFESNKNNNSNEMNHITWIIIICVVVVFVVIIIVIVVVRLNKNKQNRSKNENNDKNEADKFEEQRSLRGQSNQRQDIIREA